jgi:hypothetical protein
MKRLSSRHIAEAESHLETARQAQAYFWSALSDLETCLRVEIESTIDLRDARLEDLLDLSKRRMLLGIPQEAGGSSIQQCLLSKKNGCPGSRL